VDFGVQRLDAAIQAFHRLSVLGHVHDVQTGIAKGLGGSTRRQEMHIFGRQERSEFDNAGLVRNGNEGTGDGDDIDVGACERLKI
jgi:hypothetical protein